MKIVSQTEERMAVHIAAVVMQAAGMCRHDDYTKCRRFCPTDESCVDCIEKWLLAKARSEIRRNKKDGEMEA